MIHVQCNGCHTSAYVECTCPEGWDAGKQGHVPPGVASVASAASGAVVLHCPLFDLGSNVTCPEDSDCCKAEEVHPGLSHDMAAHLGHPNMVAGNGEADHEGEHTKENPDCAVCRPVTITVLPGSAEIRMTALA